MSHIRPRCFQLLLLVLLSRIPHAAAQTIDDLNQRWHDTFVALKNGQQDTADALFKNFNQDLRLYLQKNNADWRVEFLAGSLECQFSQWRSTGAGILGSVLQNNRDLNEKGKAQLSSWLTACTAENHASGSTPDAPTADIIDVAVHVQTPGIHSFGKAGYLDNSEHISGAAVSPLPVNELLARRVPISEPQRALDALTSGSFPTLATFLVIISGSSRTGFDHDAVRRQPAGCYPQHRLASLLPRNFRIRSALCRC